MTQVELHSLNDRTLQRRVGRTAARYVRTSRNDWRTLCRLTLGRMYGRPYLTDRVLVLCITERGTCGVVDLDNGTAWDSRVPFPGPLNHNLALSLNTSALLESAAVEIPYRWRRILVSADQGVPEDLLRPEYWIRPTLRAVGLLTNKNERGKPRRTLEDMYPAGDQDNHPLYSHGIPPWTYSRGGKEPVQLGWLNLPWRTHQALRARRTLYVSSELFRFLEKVPWPSALREALTEQSVDGYSPLRFVEALLTRLSDKTQIDQRTLVTTLLKPLGAALRFDCDDPAVFRHISRVVYPNGPISLDLPAADARSVRRVNRDGFRSATSIIAAIRR